MALMNTLRLAIKEKRVPPIFKPSDLKAAGIEDLNANLSNYDKKNHGAKNQKLLVSCEIAGEAYYTFDEQIFD